MKVSPLFVLSALATWALAHPTPGPAPELNVLEARANASYVGYLFVHFYDRQAAVFAHLSNGNEPLDYSPLNGDKAILVPTGGTGGARDPYLVSAPDNSKHWIIATDLDIGKINNDWNKATRQGSRSLYVWESTDLVNWSSSRLVEVIGPTAGMAWAPEAIWDPSRNMYMVHWASRTFSTSDPNHTGTASLDKIFYAHTSDFRTFTQAQEYISLSSTPVIDLTILPLGNGEYLRHIKDESLLRVWTEVSSGGLFGKWTKVGGYVSSVVSEGPLTFFSNTVANRIHTWVDQYGGDSTDKGYVPYRSDDQGKTWVAADKSKFPKLTKHGVVKPLTQAQYNAVKAKWG